jgi:hypothetical protein
MQALACGNGRPNVQYTHDTAAHKQEQDIRYDTHTRTHAQSFFKQKKIHFNLPS